MRRILVPLLAIALCAVALPAAAGAATVSTGTDHVLRYAAAKGENNALTVSASGSTVMVNDAGAVIKAGPTTAPPVRTTP
jgi:hypothetical protein